MKEEECDEIWWLEGDASWLGFRIMRIGEIEGDRLDGELREIETSRRMLAIDWKLIKSYRFL